MFSDAWVDAWTQPGGAFSLCSCSRGAYLCMRLLLFGVWAASCGYVVARLMLIPQGVWGAGPYPMKYLFTKVTNWAAVLRLFNFGVALGVNVLALRSSKSKPQRTPCIVQFAWFLRPTSAVIQLVVTVIYYSLSHNWDDTSPTTWSWQIPTIPNVEQYINASRCPPNTHPLYAAGTGNHPFDLTFLAHGACRRSKAQPSHASVKHPVLQGRRRPSAVDSLLHCTLCSTAPSAPLHPLLHCTLCSTALSAPLHSLLHCTLCSTALKPPRVASPCLVSPR